MSNNTHDNAHDVNRSCKFIRAVEEAFFLLDRDHNRSINSDDFCAIAKSVGKKKTFYS
jgi:Ca2+-binding EF-hand superfamily protein